MGGVAWVSRAGVPVFPEAVVPFLIGRRSEIVSCKTSSRHSAFSLTLCGPVR